MEKVVLKVEGMSCSHCENAVNRAVSDLDGVENVSVQLEEKTVSVSFDGTKTTVSLIQEAIEDQGYDVIQ